VGRPPELASGCRPGRPPELAPTATRKGPVEVRFDGQPWEPRRRFGAGWGTRKGTDRGRKASAGTRSKARRQALTGAANRPRTVGVGSDASPHSRLGPPERPAQRLPFRRCLPGDCSVPTASPGPVEGRIGSARTRLRKAQPWRRRARGRKNQNRLTRDPEPGRPPP
jgi:hypothetical protein